MGNIIKPKFTPKAPYVNRLDSKDIARKIADAEAQFREAHGMAYNEEVDSYVDVQGDELVIVVVRHGFSPIVAPENTNTIVLGDVDPDDL